MEDDGNCLLRSFSDQFWETQECHLEVREAACSLLHSLQKNGKQITRMVSYCAYHRAPNPDTVLIIQTPGGPQSTTSHFKAIVPGASCQADYARSNNFNSSKSML
ncbi:histone-lysine N-methyltransferase ATX4, partial [Tanacetum coccineum]